MTKKNEMAEPKIFKSSSQKLIINFLHFDKLELLQDIRLAETQISQGKGIDHSLAKKKMLRKLR